MGNSDEQTIPEGVFTLVAENVASGQLRLKSHVGQGIVSFYVHPSGGAAPANDQDLGDPAFRGTKVEKIKFKSGADIYLMPVDKEAVIRVQI